MDYQAHETACVDDGATIGEGTRIWHFSHVCGKASIGRRCSLGQNTFVANNVRIGDGCKIQNNVSIYEGVELDDEVFCGPSMVFTNVRTPRAGFPRNTAEDFGPTRVGHGATIGANATIVCPRTIGQYAFIAAGAVVSRDVPDYALVVGVPGRVVGHACRCGVPLRFEHDRTTCEACGRRYHKDHDGRVEFVE
jgi:UDP-2-acetamido-3-amino-2,3-dideoxy-glucuronate N-acetyltransferase